jgi:hypothetical protein
MGRRDKTIHISRKILPIFFRVPKARPIPIIADKKTTRLISGARGAGK